MAWVSSSTPRGTYTRGSSSRTLVMGSATFYSLMERHTRGPLKTISEMASGSLPGPRGTDTRDTSKMTTGRAKVHTGFHLEWYMKEIC